MRKPPGITMLYGEVIPPVGGDTCFASLEQLYRALSPGMKSLARGPHRRPQRQGRVRHQRRDHNLGVRKACAAPVENVEVEHPVICAHPVTGRPYVFVSSVLTRFKGMTEAETKPIVDYLHGPGDAARVHAAACAGSRERSTMWANPFVLHTAINDYSGYRRVTYRTTVEGSRRWRHPIRKRRRAA